MQVEARELSMSEVETYLEQTFRHVAEQKSLGFSIVMGDDLPRTIVTDVNRVQQIIKNLLSNAFKFTEQGTVSLSVSRIRGDGLQPMLAFAVNDTGIGIPKDKQKLIFEAFQQADGTTSRKYGGTGLGLTISREIARLLGGSIEVKSMPGTGSTFTLYLPERYEAAETAASLRQESPRYEETRMLPPLPADADFTGKKVLLVDDDIRNVFAINSVLESRRMIAVHAENGRHALQALQEHPDIDLVLMDTMMPEMDGLSATQAIRQMLQFRHLPIVSLTAKAMKGDREKALAAGASDYITKPVDPDKLLSVMYMWMKKGSAQNDVPAATSGVADE
jgi:CheY-like chemotaxis protein